MSSQPNLAPRRSGVVCLLTLMPALSACSADRARSLDMSHDVARLDLAQPASALDLAAPATSAGDDLAPPSGAPDGATSDNGDLAQPQIATVAYSGTIVAGGAATAIAGAQLCAFGYPELPCATSDAQGKFTLELPEDQQTGLLVDAAGYASQLVPTRTYPSSVSNLTIALVTTTATQVFYAAANTPYPNPGNGFVRFFISNFGGTTGAAGGTASLSPAGGDGPLFANAGGSYDGTLTATSTSGTARFAALAPGTFTITAHCGSGMTAATGLAWTTANQAQELVPVVAGYETLSTFGCF